MSLPGFILKRGLSTTAVRNGKRNFKKFPIFNKRGTKEFKQKRMDPNYDLPPDKRGVRDVGYYVGDKFITIPEKIPEIIVPDLTGFKLQPYVSYRTPDVTQAEFTAQDLFNVIYAPKIAKDFKEGKLNEDGSSKEPSEEELLTPEEAKQRADKTGTDLF